MQALNVSANSAPLQSVTIRRVADEPTRQALVDDLMARTEFSDTWPFMDWIEEAVADAATKTLGAYNTAVSQWAGFIAYRSELNIRPEKPGRALLEVNISVESIYVTEQERGKGVANTLMQLAMDAVNAAIQALRAQHLLLKLDARINFTADCFSEPAYKIVSSGLNRLCSLQTEQVEVQNQIALSIDEE
jgi:GNAT superfamily N-acetyltransferase